MWAWGAGWHQELVLQKWRGWCRGSLCVWRGGVRGGRAWDTGWGHGVSAGRRAIPGACPVPERGPGGTPAQEQRPPPELPPPGSQPTLAPGRVLGPAAARLASLCPPSIPPRHPACLDRVPHLACHPWSLPASSSSWAASQEPHYLPSSPISIRTAGHVTLSCVQTWARPAQHPPAPQAHRPSPRHDQVGPQSGQRG